MRTILTIICLFLCLSANARLSFREVRTASDNILVVYFSSDTIDLNEVNTDINLWKVNGLRVKALNRYSTEADKCNHFIYLTVPKLVNGENYTITCPHGEFSFKFDEKEVFCESIKTNQVAYSAMSKVRFANFDIWLGDGGPREIEGALPSYYVWDVRTGKTITGGTLKKLGHDASSGDYVYRMDISAVPEGGPYRLTVKGYGTSYPFGVGGEFSKRLAHTSFRNLFYQRCGIQIMYPYGWNLRVKQCHTTVYQTYAPINEAKLKVNGDEPTIKVWGGYHDAGDADRRTYHMDVTSTLLTAYEAFPQYFTDRQYNIPDIFDEEFNILGSGNGIPDIIDEAEWGGMFWEYFQEEDGSIPWGTETLGYSPQTTYDKENKLFGSEAIDARTASWACGLFMHMARILKPYKPERTQQLIVRAEKAYKAAGEMIPSHLMYYNVEKYLLTGDEKCHDYIKAHASDALALADTYNGECEGFATHRWLTSFFYSYLLTKDRQKDPEVVSTFMKALRLASDKQLGYLKGNAYPLGAPMGLVWWGSNVAQGQYSFPMILLWRLTKEQKYIDAASQMMDYAMGLNPMGKCFMTGLGFNQVLNPLEGQSIYTKSLGWGPRPGILIFGPGLYTDRGANYPTLTPNTPRERQFVDYYLTIRQSEFTVYQTMCFPAAVYPILSGGGTYDESLNPYIITKQ